jgi:hypothetical protein
MSRKFTIPLLAALGVTVLPAPADAQKLGSPTTNAATINTTRSKTFRITPKQQTSKSRPTKSGSSARKKICVIYQPYHQGDNRYCSQWGTIN